MSAGELLELLAELGAPARPEAPRAELERALANISLDALKRRAAALGIAPSAVRGHKGHRRSWLDAILGRAPMEVDGEHDGNPCVGHAAVSGEQRRVYESGSGARYYCTPSGRKEYRVPGVVTPLPVAVLRLRGSARAELALLDTAQPDPPIARLTSELSRAAIRPPAVASARGARDLPSPPSSPPAGSPSASPGARHLLSARQPSRLANELAPWLPRVDLRPRENAPPRRRPSAPDADLAHARLLSRLSAWGLRERAVEVRRASARQPAGPRAYKLTHRRARPSARRAMATASSARSPTSSGARRRSTASCAGSRATSSTSTQVSMAASSSAQLLKIMCGGSGARASGATT